MKCIYREKITDKKHCDASAEYIYLGKSYCAKHMEIRNAENEALLTLVK